VPDDAIPVIEAGRRPLLRDRVLREIETLLRAGNTVLVWGPWGIGKSTWLAALHEHARRERLPCGISPQTSSLRDVTQAFARAYPEVSLEQRSQRQIRWALRLALDAQPGLLLLDDLRKAGSALRSFLRSLRGSGLGIGIAADVEGPRDLARLRALHLAYHERAFPPLRGAPLHKLVSNAVPASIHAQDRRTLVRMAAGRPGWVVRIGERLRDPEYWRGDRIQLEKLRADIAVEVLAHYVEP